MFYSTNFINSINSFRFILDKSSKKFLCPSCGEKRLVRFIDTMAGEYLPERFGRCDRESNCNYFLSPYPEYAKEVWQKENGINEINKISPQKQFIFFTERKREPKPEPIYFDFDTFKKTLEPDRYIINGFIQNLFKTKYPFSPEDVTRVIELYRLGTVAHGYKTGAVTFPFVDINSNIRTIQAKKFDLTEHTDGRADFIHSMIERYCKENNKPLPDWLNSYLKQDKYVTCLFGEHLLRKYPLNPIALVEAPKTAVICSLYFGFPDVPENLIWLAVYNKSSFSLDKLKALQGKDVYVFPDLSKDGNTFQEWQAKAKEFENDLPETRFIFSDLLENLSSEPDKDNGNDIADFLLKLDWHKFRNDVPAKPDRWAIFNRLLNQAFHLTRDFKAGTITGDLWETETGKILLKANDAGISDKEFYQSQNFWN